MGIWHEGEGDLRSNEFSSIIADFLLYTVIHLKLDVRTIGIFFSNGCTNPNRRSTLSNLLIYQDCQTFH